MGLAIMSVVIAIVILAVAAIIVIGSLTAGITLVTTGLVKRHKNGGTFPDGVKTTFGLGVGLTTFSLSILIILGLSVIYINVRNSNSLYHQAVSGTVDDMQKRLDKGVPADCSAKNNWNKPAEETELTVLGYLTITYSGNEEEKRQYREKMQLLIDYGADVNRKMVHFSDNKCIETPFLFAVDKVNYDLIELMLKNGANVNERYSDGTSAIDTINKEIIRFHNRGDEEKVKDFTKIKTLLENYGAK